jgi:hypothetical protein
MPRSKVTVTHISARRVVDFKAYNRAGELIYETRVPEEGVRRILAEAVPGVEMVQIAFYDRPRKVNITAIEEAMRPKEERQ